MARKVPPATTEPIVPKPEGAKTGNSSRAHRGDSKKRTTCFNCGKEGHIAARCRVGGGKGAGEMEKSVKDAIDRADGNAIAAAEYSAALGEIERTLKSTEAAKATAEKALAARDVALDAKIEDTIARLSAGTPIKRTALADYAWVPLVIWAIALFFEMLAWAGWRTHQGELVIAPMLCFTLRMIAGISVLWSFGSYLYYGTFFVVEQALLKFVRRIPTDDLKDLRPDSNSLQELKHKDPRLIEVSLTSSLGGTNVVLVISAELLSQLTAPRYMTLGLNESQVWDRLIRGAETNQTVNQDRYRNMLGQNVSMNTALVALYLWRQYRAEMDEAGFMFPRAQ